MINVTTLPNLRVITKITYFLYFVKVKVIKENATSLGVNPTKENFSLI